MGRWDSPLLRLKMIMRERANPAIEEEADRWFARLMAPDCDAEQHEAFERWREVPEHAEAYAERKRLWQRFGAAEAAAAPRLRALHEQVLARTQQPPEVTMHSEMDGSLAPSAWRSGRSSYARGYRLAAWMVAAAVCAGLVLVGALALRFVGGTAPGVVYATTNAVRTVTLNDGTHVQLDVDSEIDVHYRHHRRDVVMRRGRVLFDVKHDTSRPFTVDLGDSHVTVLGTRFQVLRDSDRIGVTLVRGSLRLDGDAAAGSRSERLVPGDQVSYMAQAPAAWQKRHVDSATVLAWSRGRLIFHSIPLVEAVRRVNRYARTKLRLGDPSLSELPVSGNFIAGDSALVASTWSATLPLRIERQNGEIVLLRAAPSSQQR